MKTKKIFIPAIDKHWSNKRFLDHYLGIKSWKECDDKFGYEIEVPVEHFDDFWKKELNNLTI